MNKLIRLPWVRGLIIILCVVVSIGLIRSIASLWQKRDMVENRRKVLEYEQTEHEALEAQAQVATTSAYLEEVARNKLGLVKEGETVVLLDQQQTTNNKEQITEQENLPNWKRWVRLFF